MEGSASEQKEVLEPRASGISKERQGHATQGNIAGELGGVSAWDSGCPGGNFVFTLRKMEDHHRVVGFLNQLF